MECRQYKAFIYAMASLATMDLDERDKQLAMAAIEAYFMTLTIPGAKSYEVFDIDIIEICLRALETLQKSAKPSHSCLVQLLTIFDDFKLLFRYIHFKSDLEARNAILKKIVGTLYHNFEQGYKNTVTIQIHSKCFEIFDEIVLAHNGDIEATLKLIMNYTLKMHGDIERPKGGHNLQREQNSCEHVYQWFIKTLATYPERLTRVLTHYIKYVVTNPFKEWIREQTSRALDYAAKYDAALFTRCNQSCVEFIAYAYTAEEISIRVRAAELASNILQIESKVDWELCREQVSNIPREVILIKGIVEILNDISNTVRQKALMALQNILQNGSKTARLILTECIKYAQFNDENVKLSAEPQLLLNELRYKKPAPLEKAYTFEGADLVEKDFVSLPATIFKRQFQSSSHYLRRAGMLLMEQVVLLNPLAIYNTHFISEAMQMGMDHVAQVRKQSLATIDALLKKYANCYPLICAWSRNWAYMITDNDPKNVQFAVECFRKTVLSNLRYINDTNKHEHFMPWLIIRTLLCSQPRLYLQKALQQATNLTDRLIDQQTYSIIESHLHAANATEAWVLLGLVALKLRPKDPDNIIAMYISKRTLNSEANLLIATDFVCNLVPHCSPSTRNMFFKFMLASLHEGMVLFPYVNRILDVLYEMNAKAKHNSNDSSWIQKLHDHILSSLLAGIPNFPNNLYKIQAQFATYTNLISTTNLNLTANAVLQNFVHKYIKACLQMPNFDWNPENTNIINFMIMMAGRFSLINYTYATESCRIFKKMLKNIDRTHVVNTLIVAITDIFKRHPQLVAEMIPALLQISNSKYAVNRLAVFKCLSVMVAHDQIKLKDTVLLTLITVLVDDSPEVAEKAAFFFRNYTKNINRMLFQQCLREYPNVLNEHRNSNEYHNKFEKILKSPFRGITKRRKRYLLYNHFITNLDEITLIKHFAQLKNLSQQIKQPESLQNESGLAYIEDTLFIMRRICTYTKEKKTTTSTASAGEGEDLEALEGYSGDTNLDILSAAATSSCNTKKAKQTVQDAIKTIENIPSTVELIYTSLKGIMTPTLQTAFDKFCKCYVQRFGSEATAFWEKYKAHRKRRTTKDSHAESNSDSDIDTPLAMYNKRRTISKDMTVAGAADEQAREFYIFNPYAIT